MPRGNPQNLKPVRSKEEATKRGKSGGKKSGEARRRKKTMRELMRTLLTLPPKDEEQRKTMADLGVAKEDQTQKMLVAVGLMQRAQAGDTSAVRMLCEIAGDIYTSDENESDENITDTLKEFHIEFVDASKQEAKGENNNADN